MRHICFATPRLAIVMRRKTTAMCNTQLATQTTNWISSNPRFRASNSISVLNLLGRRIARDANTTTVRIRLYQNQLQPAVSRQQRYRGGWLWKRAPRPFLHRNNIGYPRWTEYLLLLLVQRINRDDNFAINMSETHLFGNLDVNDWEQHVLNCARLCTSEDDAFAWPRCNAIRWFTRVADATGDSLLLLFANDRARDVLTSALGGTRCALNA